ncbi:beta-lactamase regulator AmpE [Alteromonas sp. ASW11-36]|uniref:Beta-lactamase regulator AmpE n=1 Tax=Alteromonas arenosi TaxID=3055817 RepID=A0ABT7STQ3_9ALTE|nr:beta-lactamase regulator AmpE [Alteromonas sp. ASW11-36]MDM7859551.1 beta-lactamase regulator AmpE [Alteromonas sp. ASW11-36]
MTLLSLLFALILERVTVKTEQWRAQYYSQIYLRWLVDKDWLAITSDRVVLILVMLVPALLVYFIGDWLGSGLLGLVFNTAILYICLGCPNLRATYKCFLQAANRGDVAACGLYAETLGHDNDDDSECGSFGQHLVWLNYTHYAAIIVFFIAFGAAGAVLYVVASALLSFVRTGFVSASVEETDKALQAMGSIVHWLDFIPVRLTALGFLLVGHFGRAGGIWFEKLFDLRVPAKSLLCQVSTAAEDIEPSNLPANSPEAVVLEPKTLVKLAKRNITFLVTVVSILTVVGAL